MLTTQSKGRAAVAPEDPPKQGEKPLDHTVKGGSAVVFSASPANPSAGASADKESPKNGPPAALPPPRPQTPASRRRRLAQMERESKQVLLLLHPYVAGKKADEETAAKAAAKAALRASSPESRPGAHPRKVVAPPPPKSRQRRRSSFFFFAPFDLAAEFARRRRRRSGTARAKEPLPTDNWKNKRGGAGAAPLREWGGVVRCCSAGDDDGGGGVGTGAVEGTGGLVRVASLRLASCGLRGFVGEQGGWRSFLTHRLTRTFLVELDLSSNPNLFGDIATFASMLAGVKDIGDENGKRSRNGEGKIHSDDDDDDDDDNLDDDDDDDGDGGSSGSRAVNASPRAPATSSSSSSSSSALESLVLAGCAGFTGNIQAFGARDGSLFPRLRRLSLRGCAALAGDVGALRGLRRLRADEAKGLDVRGCPMVTELPKSWLLRCLRPRVRQCEQVAREWPPWDWAAKAEADHDDNDDEDALKDQGAAPPLPRAPAPLAADQDDQDNDEDEEPWAGKPEEDDAKDDAKERRRRCVGGAAAAAAAAAAAPGRGDEGPSSPDWRICYDRLRARPKFQSARWLAARRPELAKEWALEEARHLPWPRVNFSGDGSDDGVGEEGDDDDEEERPGDDFVASGGCFGAEHGNAPSSSVVVPHLGGLPQGGDGASDSDGTNHSSSSADGGGGGSGIEQFLLAEGGSEASSGREGFFRRRESLHHHHHRGGGDGGDGGDDDDNDGRQHLVDTPSAHVPATPSASSFAKVASNGWILALRLPNCGVSIDIGDLFPILLSPWLKHLDLSRNKKVRGNVDVFKKEVFHSLREVYLHYSAVTGDYSSFRSGLGTKLPHLEVATLLETKVTGDIACLPGDNERSSLDVHAKVERI